MRRSSTTARILTTVIALVLVPIALVLMSAQGRTVQGVYFEFGHQGDLTRILVPVLLQVLAGALLLLVVLTGIWSSAGLIVVGAFGVVAFLLSVVPVLMFAVYRAVPSEWTDSAVYGIPLLVLTVLASMGLVLALVRRDPRPTSAGTGVVGVVASPLLLAGGGFLLAAGVANGPLLAMQRFESGIQPLAALSLLGGMLLVGVGILAARWSPFALVIPGVVLVVCSILFLVAPETVFPAVAQLPRGVNIVVPAMILFGGSGVTGAAYLVFTAVLLWVRAQARSHAPVDGSGPGVGGFPGQGPVPGQFGAQYPGQFGGPVPGQVGSPPAGAYPPGLSSPPPSGTMYPPAPGAARPQYPANPYPPAPYPPAAPPQ